MDDERTTRRAYLGALGTALATGIAGCGDALGDRTTTNSTTASSTTDGSMPAETTVGGPANATAATADATAAADPATATATDGNATADSNATAGDTPSPYTQVYRETIDSVVLIQVTTARGGGQGSGFVFQDNYIVTNAHVVSNAQSVRVRFARGQRRSATVVGTDPSSDLAVLEVQNPPQYANPLPLVENEPAIGTKVAAIGSPYSLEGSITSGIISAVNRSIPAPNGGQIPDGIQTDAPVNPGNSGGPLLNLQGEVVGVVNSGGGENLAFAVSAALLKRVVPSLIRNGEYEHAYMGIRLGPATSRTAGQTGRDRSRGVVVASVSADGPSAGVLRSGDVIVGLGGTQIDRLQDLSSYLALQASPGDTIDVTVLRNGERRTLSLTLGSRPEQPDTAAQPTTTR